MLLLLLLQDGPERGRPGGVVLLVVLVLFALLQVLVAQAGAQAAREAADRPWEGREAAVANSVLQKCKYSIRAMLFFNTPIKKTST